MQGASYLAKIMQYKKQEVEQLLAKVQADRHHPLMRILTEGRPSSNHFSAVLIQPGLSVIAEIKRRSPSLGEIRQIADPAELALKYCTGGASAISVLTDHNFNGSIADLQHVAGAVRGPFPGAAFLRKDFVIHPIQLAEAVAAGAHAVLFIAHLLGEHLKMMLAEAKRLGLEALTEVHDQAGLDIALDAAAPIIGVNHRNLDTFELDLNISQKFRPQIPEHVIAVAESGIHHAEDARRMQALGFDAILVGEALVRAENPAQLIREFRGI